MLILPRLALVAVDHGAAVNGPVSQGLFLERLGLNLRAEMLCKGKSPDQAQAIKSGAYRISAPDQMGEIFKVMCLSSPDSPSPSGFDDL